jgi:hypothetical protein
MDSLLKIGAGGLIEFMNKNARVFLAPSTFFFLIA